MRLYRNAIILLVILGLLGGAYVFISKKNPKGTTTEDNTTKVEKIVDIEKAKISEVTLVTKDGKFVFAKKDDAWTLASPQDFKADNSKIDSIVSNLASLVADKIVDENAANLDQYGFSNPIQISIKYDGGTKELEMGDLNSTKDAYYMKEKGSSKVYTVGKYTGDAIAVAKNDLRDKTLYELKPEETLGLSMSKAGNLVFTVQKGEDSQWVLKAPIEGNADVSKVSPILDALSKTTSYMNFIEENPADLDKYGLKNPAYSLEFETYKGKTKLLLGNEKEKGTERYAKLADKNEVFTIDDSSLNFLDKPLKEIIEVFAYITNIQDVSKIEVAMDGKTTVSDVAAAATDSQEEDKFKVDGKDANMKDEKDNSIFKKYYQALIGVTMDEIDTTGKPTAKADITFTYYLKKAPGTMKVEFIPKDENYYYVVKNGKYANILVAKKKFDEAEGVRDMTRKILEAINK